MGPEPNTLQEAIIYFSSPDNCRAYLVARRWPNGVTCPRCGSQRVIFQPKYNRWQCGASHPLRQFTSKTGTVMEDSPIGLDKWLTAMWQIVNCKNGISSYEVHRAIGITQKSAWFMDHRIRYALGMGPAEKLCGEVEVDGTFIGGKARFMHKDKKLARRGGKGKAPGPEGKAIVAAVLQRGGKVRAQVVGGRKKQELQAFVKGNVEAGSALYSDDLRSYDGLDSEYAHQVIDHAEAYVRGKVHTNGLENFWSLLKRGINGTYVSIEPFHVFRYVDEQAFRFNNREGMNDGDRFSLAVSQIVGKRLTWNRLTGKELPN